MNMKWMNHLLGPLSVAALAVATTFASSFWQEKPYTEWTEEEVNRLLTDSPWTQEIVVRVSGPASAVGMGRSTGQPTGQGGAQTAPGSTPTATIRYYVSFLTATPIRMALARNALLQGSVQAEHAQQFVDHDMYEGSVAVMIRTEPVQALADFERMSVEDVQDSSYLELRGKKRRLTPVGYVKPSESGGMGAIILFSREELELSGVKELQFDLRSTHRLNRRFKLNEMKFQEQLEL